MTTVQMNTRLAAGKLKVVRAAKVLSAKACKKTTAAAKGGYKSASCTLALKLRT